MAELFLAEREAVSGTRRRVVLKRILPGFARDPMFTDRFIHEAQVAMQLSHANIVQVHDFLKADGTYILVMEYVEGCDLRTLLRSHGPVPVSVALHIAASVLRGLGYAHRRCTQEGMPLEIVHRDVSPGNILLSTEGEVKLTDFGLARSKEQLGRSEGGVKGTFAFMAPEQAEGRAVDRRADLFATGAVLYAALTGESPFAADGPAETLDQVRAGRYRPLSARVRDLPSGLEAMVQRALSVEVSERFADAEAMREALEGVAQQHGLRLRPDDLVEFVVDARQYEVVAPMVMKAPEGVVPLQNEPGEHDDSASSIDKEVGRLGGVTVVARPRASRRNRLGSWLRGASLIGVALVGVAFVGVVAIATIGGTIAWRHRARSIPPTTATPTHELAPVPFVAPQLLDPPRAAPPPTPPSGRVETARPASAKERPATAFVTINAAPWARVSIDGRERGTTPLLNLSIAPGSHDIQLANPELGVTRHTAVRLRPGEHKTIIEKLVREER